MPKPFQYTAGSIIYCKGEDANKIFILQKGKVCLVSADIESGADIRNQVQPGEFFGVKSALGHFPREENALTLADSTIMAFTVPEFEALVTSHTRIILKMLKVFSNQMRKTHAQVSNLTSDLAETEAIKPEKGLFTIGEKYLKTKRYAYAKYIFGRYLEHYPTGADAKQAAKHLHFAETKLAKSAEEKEDPAAVVPETETAAAETAAPPPGNPALEKAYYDALDLIAQTQYDDALQGFNKIVESNEDPEWTQKSAYEAGHCYFLLGKFEDCIKYYTKFLADYPEYPDLRDAMFYVGQSYEKLENKEEAMSWYKKIVAASGEEKDSARTKALKAFNDLKKKG